MKRFLFSLVLILNIFFVTNVYAKEISIQSIELVSKDDETEITNDISYDQLNLNIGLKFYTTGNYARYRIVIKNSDDTDYIINNSIIYDEDKLVKYEFIFDDNNKLKANSTKTFYLSVSYINELTGNKSSYKVDKDVIIDIIRDYDKNPLTARNGMYVLFVTMVIIMGLFYTSNKKTYLLLFLLLLLTPFKSSAAESITITINENIEIIKTRLAYSCYSSQYLDGNNKDSFCINWSNYIDYNSYQKDDAYLLTTNTDKLPNVYSYNDISYTLSNTYDVSDLQNGKVTLGVYYNSDDVVLLLIGQNKDINSPIEADYLFFGGIVNNIDYPTNILYKTKDIDLEYFDTSDTKVFEGIFYYDFNLEKINLSKLDTSNVSSMQSMFSKCEHIKSIDISNFDTSKVTTMRGMFGTNNGDNMLEEIIGIEDIDTTSLTDISVMFQNCSNLEKLDLSKWDTSKVTEMNNIFYGCTNLTELKINTWNTSNVVDMKLMFTGCLSLEELDWSSFDTSNVTNMRGMFSSNIDSYYDQMSLKKIKGIEDFNTSNVTDMRGLFFGNANITTLDLRKWDTSKVTTMRSIFTRCLNLKNLYISNWDVSKVTDFYDAIRENKIEELDLSGWKPESMTICNRLFNQNGNLNKLDIRNFDFTIVPDTWDSWAYTFNGLNGNIEIIVKDEANKQWILSHNSSNLKEENITIAN